jgi:hypothetical protein
MGMEFPADRVPAGYATGEAVRKALFFLLVTLAAGWFSLVMTRKYFAGSLETLAEALDRQVGAWTATGQDGTYDGETIYDYIDGAGEVYRAYNMRGCLSRRYAAAGEPDIVLDIFDMGSSEDAFGVFTHDRDGSPADVGRKRFTGKVGSASGKAGSSSPSTWNGRRPPQKRQFFTWQGP